jgi:hypothetical protein
MRKFIFYLVILLLTIQSCSRTKIDIYTNVWRYQLEAAFVSKAGTKTFKIWSYCGNPSYGMELAKRNAVHGIIFKGIPASADGRIQSQMPLIKNGSVESSNQMYFNSFFANGGPYLRFVSLATDDQPDLVKISNKEFKIGLLVSVDTELLRKQLESDGIIRKLGL